MSMDRETVVAALEAALMMALAEARSAMDELSSSLGKETKSTAGDKHETGRAMVQREMEQAGDRLARCEALQTVAIRLDLNRARAQLSAWSHCGQWGCAAADWRWAGTV